MTLVANGGRLHRFTEEPVMSLVVQLFHDRKEIVSDGLQLGNTRYLLREYVRRMMGATVRFRRPKVMEHRVAVIRRLPRPVEHFSNSDEDRCLANPILRVFFDERSELVRRFSLRFG